MCRAMACTLWHAMIPVLEDLQELHGLKAKDSEEDDAWQPTVFQMLNFTTCHSKKCHRSRTSSFGNDSEVEQ